jgi:hypothetical protein
LILRSLVAYDPPLYQILSLPPQPLPLPSKEGREKREHEKAIHFFKTLQEVLK